MAENRAKMSTGKKALISLILILIFLTAGVYVYGVYYFSGHFLPGSMVNGFNCSYMTVEETEDLLNERVGAYAIAIDTMKNGREAITAREVDLSYVSTGGVEELIKNQNRFTWFLSFNQNQTYNVAESLRYDEE